MRAVWPATMHPTKAAKPKATIYCAAPHGVMPCGVSAYAFYFFSDRLCRWTAAPVVFSLPVIGKLMKAMGTIPASSKNIARALNDDQDVGVVLDGIAGMFSATSNEHETAYLSQRKQICAIALKQGDCQIVPVYWYGHSALWKTIVDPFGILKKLSVKSNISLVPFVGRWWWPLGPAKRVSVLIAFGEPVVFPANPEHTKPSKEVSHILITRTTAHT